MIRLNTAVAVAVLWSTAAGWAAGTTDGSVRTAPPSAQVRDIGAAADAAMQARVVYIGETHDNYSHHRNQLALIEALHVRDPDLAIGMEMFQRPFQSVLDRYVRAEIDTDELLRQSGYYERWRFDFRHYQPILEFARAHALPVLALNAPRELIARVSEVGLDGLEADERGRLPKSMVTADGAYLDRLRQAYEQHEEREEGGFGRFLDVQLAWDETMADTVADYLDRHPGRRMVVLAGSGHVAFGDGIPSRVARRLPVDSLVVLHDDDVDDPRAADLWLGTDGTALPPAGMLGVFVEPAQPGLRITGFGDDSGARDAGLVEGDLIVAVDGAELDGFADLKIALRDHLAGDRVRLRVRRQGSGGHATDDVEVELR